MMVIKRDGCKEPLNINQIRKQTIPACAGLEGVSYEELEFDAQIFFKDNISTTHIQQALIKAAINKVDIDTPNWTYVAERLSLYDLYHKVKHAYNKRQSGDVYKIITLKDYIERNINIFSDWHTKYTEEEIDYLNNLIDKDRDLLFDYAGFELLKDMYLAKNDGIITELPQHMHMAIAMFTMQDEHKDIRLQYVEDYYYFLSTLKVVNATPINANARLISGGLISCILLTVEDSLSAIMDKAKECALSSKLGSGVGIDVARVRSLGSDIGINKNAAGGKIPFLKIFNSIAIAVDQSKRRPGAFAAFTESWDLEIFDFINLKKHNGDERRRAHDLFLSVSYSDLFFKREEEDGDWTLFDPHDALKLTETFGEEFEEEYIRLEQDYKENPSKYNPNTKTVKARDVLRAHMLSMTETGGPFFMFKDNVNNAHANKDYGIIRSLNLCQEVALPVKDELTGVCNLGSLNLARIENEDELKKASLILLRALDNNIDLTEYPTKTTREFQLLYRAVGVGTLGEAEMIANKQIYYGSDEHKELIDKIWKCISSTLKEGTLNLGKEKGECDALYNLNTYQEFIDVFNNVEDKKSLKKYLTRNSYLMAIAPNSSSAILAGTTNGIEPVYSKIWTEENKRGSFVMTAPHININNFEYYKNPYEIDPLKQIEVNAIRQKYVDMSISMNLFLEPEGLSLKKIRECIVYAWKNKLKSIYYLRSKPPKGGNSSNKRDGEIVCVGCAN